MGYLDITQQKASISLLLQYIEMTLAQLQEKKKQQQKNMYDKIYGKKH